MKHFLSALLVVLAGYFIGFPYTSQEWLALMPNKAFQPTALPGGG
jgi:hypothetical protein